MREKVIKKVRFGRNAYAVVCVDHVNHTVGFESVGGSSPYACDVLSFLINDKDVVAELRWAIKSYKRKHPIYFNWHEGMSGCLDVQLMVAYCKHDWAVFNGSKKECVLPWHISCAGKFNENIPDMFSGDLLDMLHFCIEKLGFGTKGEYVYMKHRPNYYCPEYESLCGSEE